VRPATAEDFRWLCHYADCVLSPGAVGLAAVDTFGRTNAKALRFNARLGFREVRREADGFGDGVDKVWMELRREDCRWLQRKAA
jgi:hypothetical protein